MAQVVRKSYGREMAEILSFTLYSGQDEHRQRLTYPSPDIS